MLLRTGFLATILLLLACGETDNPLMPAPEAAGQPLPTAKAFPANAPAGSMLLGTTAEERLDGSFTFLPPLPEIATTGAFDGRLLNDLTVEICVPASCGTNALASFDAAGDLKMDPATEQYQINWNTRNYDLTSSKVYRIRVLVLGLEIGYTDVEMVSTGKELKTLETAGTIGLVDGRTLPIKFRIERNSLVDAWRLAGGGASADAVAAMLETVWSADVATVVELLALAGYPAAEVAGVLRNRYGQDATQSLEWLMEAGLVAGPAEAFAALAGAGYSIDGIADALTDEGTPAEVAGILADAGAPAAAVGDWLLGAIGASNPDAITEVAAILDGAGYSFDDVVAWVGANTASSGEAAGVLNDAGYGADLVLVYLEVTLALPIDQTIADLATAGYSESEVVGAATSKTTANLETIVQAMIASFDTAAEDMAELLDDTGVAAGAAASAVMGAYDFTLEQTLKAFRTSEFAVDALAEFAWETIGDVPGRLGMTMDAVRLGLGASFDKVKDWAWEKAADTVALLEAAGLSGYSSAEIVAFLVDVAGASADQIMDMGARYGMAAADLVEAMATETMVLASEIAAAAAAAYDLTAAEVAVLLDQAGYTAGQVYGAVAEAFDLSVAGAIAALRELGLAVNEMTDWALVELAKTNPDAAAVLAAILVANDYAWTVVTDMVFKANGFTAEAFQVFRDLSFDPGAAALRALAAGGDFMDVFNAMQAAYELPLEAAAELLKGAGIPVDRVGAWLMAKLGASVTFTARFMNGIGYTAGEVADFVYRVLGRSRAVAADALAFAGYRVSESILALKQFTNASAGEAAQFARDIFGLSKDATADVLRAASYPLTDVVGALLDTFTWGIGELEALLVSIGFALADVIAALGA